MAIRKPRDKFPLWLHPRGFWCKKIRGHFHYFGKDKDAALAEYVRVKDDLLAGRKPREKDAEGKTVADIIDAFLSEKRSKMDAGELSARTWSDYYAACATVAQGLGKARLVADLRPDDFAKLRASVAIRLGPVSVLNFITRVRVLFKFAFDFGLIETPVRYGAGFDRPQRKTLRAERAKKGVRLIPAADIRKMIEAADPQLRAMILLGLNGGMGSSDLAQLPRAALEVRPGWLDYARVKTATPRRFALWPETIAALEAVHGIRPKPKPGVPYTQEAEGIVFLTRYGLPWVRFNGDSDGKRSVIDSVAQQFTKLGAKCGVKLPGSFYVLRHVHRTVSDEVGDRAAVDLIMGHSDPTMAGHYRESIADERLKAVTDHVRAWLLKDTAKTDGV